MSASEHESPSAAREAKRAVSSAPTERTPCALPRPFLGALALGAAFFAFVAWDQSHWWRVKEDYAFGWLVPAFVAFVVYDRWPRILAAAGACADPDCSRVAGGWNWVLRGAVASLLAGGALLFLLGAFYRAGAGTSQPGTLAITLGAGAIVLALFFLNAPERHVAARAGNNQEQGTSVDDGGAGAGRRPDGRSIAAERHEDAVRGSPSLFADPRVRLTALFLFPTLVWLVSAPMVSAVETQLNLFLLRKVVLVVSGAFDLLGLPIEQQGNVLVLPTGRVGVQEACSGIRSLTGCLFAGSFLAAVFLDRVLAKVLLVAASLVLAFVTNLLRGLFLTGWAYRHGPDALDGAVHDLAGYAVLGLTVLGLFCLLPVFRWVTERD